MIASRPPLLTADRYADLIRSTPGLIGYYRMREPSGTVMRDELNLVNGVYGAAPILGRGTPIEGGAAPMFNGTNQYATIAKNLSAYAQLSLSFWMYWDAYANNDDLAFEYTPNAFNPGVHGLYVDPNESSTGAFVFGTTFSSGASTWRDRFTRPTAAVWHHYLLTMDRATPVNTAFVDAFAQTLTTVQHNAGTYGTFANSTLYVMSRAAAAIFGAGRMSELALFGRILTQNDAAAHYNVGIGR